MCSSGSRSFSMLSRSRARTYGPPRPWTNLPCSLPTSAQHIVDPIDRAPRGHDDLRLRRATRSFTISFGRLGLAPHLLGDAKARREKARLFLAEPVGRDALQRRQPLVELIGYDEH